MLHEAEGFDPVAGVYVPTPCYFGRPDWNQVFNKITDNHPGARVGVFVCGGPTLAGAIKGLCIQKNALVQNKVDRDSATTFSFHKENF